jgi:hypothetical protein
MQLPRYSFRRFILAFTVVAFVAMIVGDAVADWAWTVLTGAALAAAIAVASVPIVLLLHALLYGLFYLAGSVQPQVVARTSRGGLQRTADENAESDPPASDLGSASQ